MKTEQREMYYERSAYSFARPNGSDLREFSAEKFIEDSDEIALQKFNKWKDALELILSPGDYEWITKPDLRKIEHITTITKLA